MIDVSTLSPEERKIIEARREYQRKWRIANKHKTELYKKHFYGRLASESQKRAENKNAVG